VQQQHRNGKRIKIKIRPTANEATKIAKAVMLLVIVVIDVEEFPLTRLRRRLFPSMPRLVLTVVRWDCAVVISAELTRLERATPAEQ
jgi:hypothetical protein